MRRRRTCLCGAQRATADQACLFGGCLGRQAQRWRGGRSRPLEVQAQRAEASADRREGTTEPAGSRPKGSMRSTRGATRPQAGGPHKPCNVDLAQDSGKPCRATHSNSQKPAPDLRLRVLMRNQKPGGGIFGGSGLEPLQAVAQVAPEPLGLQCGWRVATGEQEKRPHEPSLVHGTKEDQQHR